MKDHEAVLKGLGKLIRLDARWEQEDIQRELAAEDHDNHIDSYDIYPDPLCRHCKDDGYLDDWNEE